MSELGYEAAPPRLRVSLNGAWGVAGPFSRVVMVAWLLLPFLLVLGLTHIPWKAGDAAQPELTPWYVSNVMESNRRGLDDHAKADAGTLGSLMEACFARTRDFAACDEPSELPAAVSAGVRFGDGKGELHVTGVTGRTFALSARSRSTTSFTITRGANGRLLHGCSRPGHGGCRPDGRW